MGRLFTRWTHPDAPLREAQKAVTSRPLLRSIEAIASHRKNTITLLVLGLLGVVIAPIATVVSVRRDAELRDMPAWTQVEGTVVRSWVDERRGGYRGGGPATFHHAIEYRYVFDGRTFTNDRVTAGQTGLYWHDRSSARDALPRHGATLTVHVNPSDPARSVLRFHLNDPGSRRWTIILGSSAWVLSLALTAFAAAMIPAVRSSHGRPLLRTCVS